MEQISYIQNGCEANLFDSERAKEFYKNAKFGVFPFSDQSKIVAFHTCTFTQQKENETIKKIKDLLSTDVQKVIVTGCFLKEYVKDNRVVYIKNGDLYDKPLLQPQEVFKTDESKQKDFTVSPVVRISSGCYGNCTFCSIKFVKGKLVSRSMENILLDIEKRKNSSYIKLVGEEVAGYGIDIGLNLKKLLEEIINNFPDLKIKLGSLNVKILKKIKEEDLRILAHENIAGNIHIPFQSADNNILKSMNRGYSIEEYVQVYGKLKRFGIKRISSDVICGFPGEDNTAHEKNIAFIKDFEFEFMEIFAFQERLGTKAALLPQLEISERENRTMEMIINYLKSYCIFKNISIEELISQPKIFNTNIKFTINENN